jgi:VWFA-related protein
VRLSYAGLVALAAIAFGQAPIRVTTRLIETTVIVRDHRGPVGDLGVESFKIFDNGKEKKIAVFRVSKPELVQRASSTPAPPPGVFSNRFKQASPRPERRVVLLIDTLNTEPPDQRFIQTQMLEMLKDGVQDPTAIYIFGDKSRMLQNFTTDVGLLKKAVESFHPELTRLLFMSNTPTPMPCPPGPKVVCIEYLRNFQELRDHANRSRALKTIDAFQEIAKYLAPFPGKKSVVWVSDSFPSKSFAFGKAADSSYRLNAEEMQALNRANITIYGVHARGLVVAMQNPRDPTGPPVESLADETDSLNWVAEETGGRAFYGRNDIGAAIREAMEDGDVTYTLGFYAQNDKPDGAFHRLKVKVDRPGVEVRHREGYFDADKKVDTKLDSRPPVAEDANDIGLIAAIARKDSNYQVAVQIDFKDLRLESENGRWKGSAELAFLALSADGRVLDAINKSLNFDMTDDAYRARLKEGFALEQTIASKTGIAKIRIVVVDGAGGAGSVTLDPASLPSK